MGELTKNIVTGPNGHIGPDWFWLLTKEEIKAKSNGCGPGGWKIDLVPNRIMGVDFTESCDEHDIMYDRGEDEEDKRIADMCLLYNIQYDINQHYPSQGVIGRAKRRLCRQAGLGYYMAVDDFGRAAFGKGKDVPL